MAIGYILFDALTLAFAIAFYGGALFAAEQAYLRLVLVVPWPVALVFAGVAFLVALVTEVSVATALTPRLEPGRYPVGKGAVFWSWMLRLTFSRLLFLPGIKTLLFSSAILRFLTLRGLGAKVAFTASISVNVDLTDPALLRIGPAAMLGGRVLVGGHFIDKGLLHLDQVHIGAKALIGTGVIIGPGVVVGEGATLSPEVMASVSVTIGKGAIVGMRSLLEPGSAIADGAKVPAGTHLRPKARFPDVTT